MNSAHYDKMKELFSRACVNGGKKSLPSRSSATGVALSSSSSRGALPLAAWAGDFHDSLFACLMRYEALQVGRRSVRFLFFFSVCSSQAHIVHCGATVSSRLSGSADHAPLFRVPTGVWKYEDNGSSLGRHLVA